MVDDEPSRLISDLQQRNQDVWNEVVQRHASEIYGFVFHLVGGDRSVAEELTQETWLAAVDGIDGCDVEKGEFRSWLFGIARNRVALHYRRRATGGVCVALAESCDQFTARHDLDGLPGEAALQVERNAAVRAALMLLPVERRELMISKYVDGLSVKAIAAGTGRTVKAVESLLTRARQQLRSYLTRFAVSCGDERPAKEDLRHD
ncbi:MAG: sigma-70 family RNA polymerase sigma factor [Planctomycetales bacterium]|nr:sigma-70 family RNA polymerase sigma factor [Planctomycetales bacterium]